MSRAFVKEDDDADEALPDRPISSAPNLVTQAGFDAIEAELTRLNGELSEVGDDRELRARVARDLRYWSARRASAQIVAPPEDAEIVRFGALVTLERDDGRTLKYRIVGEDEADPEAGTLSHVAPLARAVLGRSVGDEVRVGEHTLEIVAIA
jgi:transcription elongation GreA/GreB family factor